jgi:hypothetical protein
MLSGGELVRLDPTTGASLGSVSVGREDFQACGIARGPGDRLYVTAEETGELFIVRMGDQRVRAFEPTGEVPAAGCLMTVAKRR